VERPGEARRAAQRDVWRKTAANSRTSSEGHPSPIRCEVAVFGSLQYGRTTSLLLMRFLRSIESLNSRSLYQRLIHRKGLAFDFSRREDLCAGSMFQSGQLVRVNLAGLQAEGVMFQAAVTDAVGHIVKQTSEQPPKYLVKLLFSFRGVTEVEVPADRIHADR
jgi:hypothetical protein